MLNFGKCYKYLDQCANGFWSAKNILTYGRPVNVVTGTRSVGKSTGVACLCLINYMIYGKKFMYVRRRSEDTFKTCKTFFDNAIEIVNRYCKLRKIEAFKAYNGKYYIAFSKDEDENPIWEECGLYTPLSKEENLKSSVFSDYTIIIYDEFISKDPNKYIGTKDNIEAEWNALVSLYQTVDRGVNMPYRNETVLFMLANKATMYNPICLTIGLSDYVQPDGVPQPHFTNPKGAIWVWEDVGAVEATVDYKDSFSYQMSSDSVKKYAYENQETDSKDFIKRPGVAFYDRTVRLKGVEYGIYHDIDFQFYIDKAKPGYAVISLDTQSHNPTSHFIKTWEEDMTLQAVTMAYRRGKLYFGNAKIQRLFLQYLDFMK